MKYKYNPFETAQTINKVLMAYFINILENKGVILIDHKPIDNFTHPVRELFDGKIVIENFDIEFLNKRSIEEFFTDSVKEKIDVCAKNLSEILKKYPYYDLLFVNLPDQPPSPFISSIYTDEETRFCGRIILGKNFGEEHLTGIFYFSVMIVDRMREIDPFHPYEKIFKNVENMTDEEREKYDRKESECESI